MLLSNVQWKCYGCCIYGMKKNVCVMDIDMELPAVISCKVLCRYVEETCGV